MKSSGKKPTNKKQLAEKHINRSWEKEPGELRAIAKDRRKWKEFVDNICS
jgi:hypothetical protein